MNNIKQLFIFIFCVGIFLCGNLKSLSFRSKCDVHLTIYLQQGCQTFWQDICMNEKSRERHLKSNNKNVQISRIEFLVGSYLYVLDQSIFGSRGGDLGILKNYTICSIEDRKNIVLKSANRFEASIILHPSDPANPGKRDSLFGYKTLEDLYGDLLS